MTGLFVNDIQLLWQQKKTILMILVLAIVLTFEMDSSYTISYLTFVCAFLATVGPSYDEADNGYVFLFTLPVKRKTYILEKYMFAFFVTGASCLMGSLLSLVFYMARGHMDICLQEILQAIIIFPVMLLFISLMYPCQFKFGSEKSRIIMAGMIACVTIIGYVGIRAVLKAEIDIRVIVKWFKNHLVWMDLGAFAGALLVYVISGLISVRIMNKKEF